MLSSFLWNVARKVSPQGRSILPLLFLFVLGCSHGPDTGPKEIRWDREVCAECVMAVSDHYFSAQIRGGIEGRRTKVYTFDDIGCAVIWLEKQSWKDDPRTEMWVNDYRDGEWINARESYYVLGPLTPMDFSLGARPQACDSCINYEQAVSHIYEVNARLDRIFSTQSPEEGQ